MQLIKKTKKYNRRKAINISIPNTRKYVQPLTMRFEIKEQNSTLKAITSKIII